MALSTEQFVALATAHQRDIYRYILTMVPSSSDADDLYQESIMALYGDRKKFDPSTNFLAWACTVAKFKILAHRKSQQRDRHQFSPELIERLSERRLVINQDLADRRLALDHCLRRLTPRQRHLIDQRYGGQITMNELARQSGRSVHTLYKTLDRVRRSLAACIERQLSRVRA